MSIKVRATYDGNVLQLKEPLDLAVDTEVELTIVPCVESEESEKNEAYSLFQLADKIAIDGPTDWSTRYKDYLYPDPPRSRRGDES